MSVRTNLSYIIIILVVGINSCYHKERHEHYRDAYFNEREEFFTYADEQLDYMSKWSLCLSDKATETMFLTKCNNELYDIRNWLSECKCKCTGKQLKLKRFKEYLENFDEESEIIFFEISDLYDIMLIGIESDEDTVTINIKNMLRGKKKELIQ